MGREVECAEEAVATVSCDDFLAVKYEEVYAALYAHLQEQRKSDPGFMVDDVRGFLKDAYVRMGNEGIGNGPLFEATQSATIAAYEVVLAEWLDELAGED
ncbi:MAG: hypothetical protein J7M39_15590 [Anaerolineae bacterium]|nr:hypothetical protein [Anaerolineae bacterium]